MKPFFLMAALLGAAYGQTVWVAPQSNESGITDRPFSGTEQRHSLQVLGDGTHIETKETNHFYRDAQGRTRTERENGLAEIHDPVRGVSFEIDTVSKQVRYAISKGQNSAAAAYTSAALAKLAAEAHALQSQTDSQRKGGDEDLGMSVVNGVAARGTRHTTTIAVGEIGNDRPIKIVSERWYSEDLQMLVKSGNSDPRFGDTTYEMTNISQLPGPALFQMPADYARDHGFK